MQPLAYRMRPTNLTQIVGQKHLTNENGILGKLLAKNTIVSMIFYGPSGIGKTTLATVIANSLKRPYRFFNAVQGNKKDLSVIFEEAKYHQGLILIMDEVHRLNKDKQDLLLPHLEDGSIILLGATTANPFYAINPALRSRAHLVELMPINEEDIYQLLVRALEEDSELNNQYTYDEDLLKRIAKQANGDVRYALNLLELCTKLTEDKHLTLDLLANYTSIPNLKTDASDDYHYDLLSAFQKSIRGSDTDAALIYLATLLEINDLVSLERRLLVIAYEDIGLANLNAASKVIQAIESAKKVGMPEARIILATVVIELCLSPKSKSAEHAIDHAIGLVRSSSYQIPDYLKMTPTNLEPLAKYDYGNSYSWPLIQYLPDKYKDISLYQPQKLSNYEQVLHNNYLKLKQTKRTNNLIPLNKIKK